MFGDKTRLVISVLVILMFSLDNEEDARPFLQSNEWDLVCIFPPYTPVSTINSRLRDITSARFDVAPIDTDAIFLLVFFAKGNIEKQIRHSRNHGDILVDEIQCFKKGETIPMVTATQ